MIMEAIKTEDMKRKLKDLKTYMPDQEQIVYDFGSYLSDRLNPQLVPGGFVLMAYHSLYDLENGFDGSTHQPIRNSLVGYPSMIYGILEMNIPEIAEAVCPEEFAKGVKEYIEKVKQLKTP